MQQHVKPIQTNIIILIVFLLTMVPLMMQEKTNFNQFNQNTEANEFDRETVGSGIDFNLGFQTHAEA